MPATTLDKQFHPPAVRLWIRRRILSPAVAALIANIAGCGNVIARGLPSVTLGDEMFGRGLKPISHAPVQGEFEHEGVTSAMFPHRQLAVNAQTALILKSLYAKSDEVGHRNRTRLSAIPVANNWSGRAPVLSHRLYVA